MAPRETSPSPKSIASSPIASSLIDSPMASIDLSPDDFRRLGHRAIDLIADRFGSIRQGPVRRPVAEDQRTRWATEPPPATARDADALLDRVAHELFPYPMGNAHPRFFAWVNSPPAPLGVLADLLASALDPSVAGGDHAATYVEHAVLHWLKTITGYPQDSGGVLTSGGSVATLVGLAVMRHVKTATTDRARGIHQGGRREERAGESGTTRAADSSGLRDGGVRDSDARGSGVGDSGIRDSGIRDSGVGDGGVRDSGVRHGDVRDGGVRDSDARGSGVGDSGVRHGDVRHGDVRDQPVSHDGPLIVYTSTQGHSCIQKAVELLGLGTDHLRRVATDADHRLDVDALRRQIADDRARGLSPACVVASAGTVNTGAIDPLEAIADLCVEEGLWLHVDGAYGAVARLTDEDGTLFRGMERADSLGLDAHKWLYMPVECGCAFVRDAQAMRDTFSVVPPYLRDDTASPWFSEFTIQQTRGFKALKLWLVIQQIGLEGYRASIARDIALARALQTRIRARPDFALVAAGPLSITCFRYAPPALRPVAAALRERDASVGRDADVERDADVGRDTIVERAAIIEHDASIERRASIDALNRRLLDIVQREGHAFLTSTEVNGRPVLRACIVNFRTTEADLDILLDTIADAGERVLAAG